MSASTFSRPAVVLVAFVGAVSVVFATLLALFGEELEEVTSAEANSFSPSAIGHRAFVETLRKLGIPLVISRHGSAEKAGSSAVLVLAEPDLSEWTESRKKLVREMRGKAKRLLVILPKRSGTPDDENKHWLGSSTMLPKMRPEELLEALGLSAEVIRPNGMIARWATSGLPAPSLSDPQLVTTRDLEPVIESDQGMLVGEKVNDDSHLVVIADPDIFSTHGLPKGKNAELAVALLERLRGGEGAVVIDETLHGFEVQPSIVHELLRYPLVLAVVQALVVGVILIWAGIGRFGKVAQAPAPIAPGKGVLIDNTAELLRYGGHLDHAVHRYWKVTLDEIGREMHAPAGLDPASLRRWLAHAAGARGLSADLEELEGRVARFIHRERAEQDALLTGRAIHRFRQEMLHGSRDRKGD